MLPTVFANHSRGRIVFREGVIHCISEENRSLFVYLKYFFRTYPCIPL